MRCFCDRPIDLLPVAHLEDAGDVPGRAAVKQRRSLGIGGARRYDDWALFVTDPDFLSGFYRGSMAFRDDEGNTFTAKTDKIPGEPQARRRLHRLTVFARNDVMKRKRSNAGRRQ